MSARAMMFFLLPSLCLLGACTGTAPTRIDRYRLEAAVPSPPPLPAARRPGGVLKLSAVVAPSWLRGLGMCYRFAFHDPARSRRYADSRWVAPVASMIAQTLQENLAASGRWRAVIGPDDGAGAAAEVRVRLLDFCQVFETPGRSTQSFAARATVTRGLQVLGQRTFEYRVPAPTPDAAGGVHAASTALRRFSAALIGWLGAVGAPPRPGT